VKLLKNKIIIQGQNLKKCSHIISNNIYINNPKFTKKYQLPDNFKMNFQIKRGNVIITEIFKRQK
jgi:hypothetical protein